MLRTDCVHFPLDRPCAFHKRSGRRCAGCTAYRPVSPGKGPRILLIKLGAMGDVLRTTFLLPGIRERWPGARITWLVAKGSEPLLAGNPFIERIWPLELPTLDLLSLEPFDIVINLDLAPRSLALTAAARAPRCIGYRLDARRRIVPSNAAARRWLSLSADDDLKKRNDHTYQHWMARITGLRRDDYPIHTPLTPAAVRRAATFAARHHLKGRTVVGINPGAGGRWPLKKWTDRGYCALIRRIAAAGHAVLLLGGPEERDTLARLARRTRGLSVNGGADNALPDFFALIDLCDLLVTGDTMALHAALGLGKRAVALFGPTSAPEIEMYGRGAKVVTTLACRCCYDPSCCKRPTCMDAIDAETVWKAVRACL